MTYKVDITISGHLIVDASSESEAKEKVEDGYSMSDVYLDDDTIDEILLVK